MSAEPSIDGVAGPRRIAGRYRLLAPLGEGGMGTVWRARDEVLGREVAVKEVRAPVGLPASDVDRLYTRLEREAWAAARIPHRNVVTVYDVATEEGRPWIVMELVRGLSLSDTLEAEGPMSPQRAAQVGAEVLAALRAAHGAGVLHRDVKPGNVLIANDGRIVLTDFGIATVEGSSALTMTGEVVGSPEFLAPERALGRRPGPESDLWSLGVLLYAAVEGVSPFRQNTPLSTLRAVVDEELPPPRRAGPLTPVIEGLLRKDPAERISSGDAERGLRTVGAGGTPPAGTTQSSSLSSLPTATALRQPGPSPTPPRPVPASTGSPSYASSPATTTTTGPAHRRRTVAVLSAGMVALALALASLTSALVNRDDSGAGSGNGNATTGGGTGGDDGGGSNGGNSSTNGGGTTGGGSSPSPSRRYTNGGAAAGGSTDGGYTTGGHGGTTSTPAQSVTVTVTAVRGSYTGICPPPETEAPAFTATFTVGQVPAEVDYRWVTKTGESSDPGWKTLSFPSGDGKTKQVNHVELAYEADGTYHNEISVEVRSPVETQSSSVAFSVTCQTQTTAPEQ